jgi:hypothetical protein
MKKIIFILTLLSMTFCKSHKGSIEKTTNNEIINLSKCPENGVCTIEILENKSLNILQDDIGSTYYQLKENPSKSVVHFKYERNKIENTSDSGHVEEIIFEINKNENNLSLENIQLQNTKMLFGRHCFCRGNAGFSKINIGNLKISADKEKTLYELSFKVNDLPQLFSKIQFYQK